MHQLVTRQQAASLIRRRGNLVVRCATAIGEARGKIAVANEAAGRNRGDRATGRTARPIPKRHWRSYGSDTGCRPAPKPWTKPFNAFPSCFPRIECDRCGKVEMVNQARQRGDETPIRDILDKMRHDGCGGRAGKVELLTDVDGVSSRPVRRIVLKKLRDLSHMRGRTVLRNGNAMT